MHRLEIMYSCWYGILKCAGFFSAYIIFCSSSHYQHVMHNSCVLSEAFLGCQTTYHELNCTVIVVSFHRKTIEWVELSSGLV